MPGQTVIRTGCTHKNIEGYTDGTYETYTEKLIYEDILAIPFFDLLAF